MPDRIAYIKRFQMELHQTQPVRVEPLAEGFQWISWREDLLREHAEVQYQCFHDSIDVEVFPNFATRSGCLHVLQRIRQRSGFCPGSTWLLRHESRSVGTVQAVSTRPRGGSIQNLGVILEYRQRGLARLLLKKCLAGFQQIGLTHFDLEVTAKNVAAIRLYRSLGFRCTRTIYKPILVNNPAYAGATS